MDQGAANGECYGKVCSLSPHFHSTVKLFGSDGLHSITESPFPPQLLEEGITQLQGLKPLGLCSLAGCQGQAGCAVLCWAVLGCAGLPIWALLGTSKPTSGVGRDSPKSAGSSSLYIWCKHRILPSFGQCSRNMTTQRSPRLKSTKLVFWYRTVSLKARSI